jgi:hypothetical protein
MKLVTIAVTVALSLVAGVALAQHVADRKDLHAAEVHLHQVVNELERAARNNHYDMNGHAGKAIELAKQAEREIHVAWEAPEVNTTK